MPGADIAVLGRRPCRPHAEGDDAAHRRRISREAAYFGEGRGIGDDVIGGKRNHERIAVALGRKGGARRDRRAGIAPQRLQQDVGLDADGGELLGDEKAILGVGDDDRPAEQSRIGHPADRILERRFRTEQRQELLGATLARRRP